MRKFIAVPLVVTVLAAAASAAQPTDVQATYRAGQTFVTWKQSGAKSYKVYRSSKPITDVTSAELAGTVGADSGAYPLEVNRKVAAGIVEKDGYNARYIIQDNPAADPGKMLPAETGLLVYTVKQAGDAYYAVTANDDATVGDANRTAKPVAEKVEPVGAVLIWRGETKDKDGNVTGERRIYTHWMDAADWNAGPDGGCAYNFAVAVPAGGTARGLVLKLHGYGDSYGMGDLGQGMVTVTPGDPYQTWWYGSMNPAGDGVVNYTERRMLMTIDFVLRQLEAENVEVDASRIYTHGGSMGGTGGNWLGARHGEVFAAVLASKGAVDHNRNGKWTDDSIRRLWGAKEQNLPTNEGTKVWDHVNLIKWHLEHPEVETAFLLDAHASNDESVPFGAVPEYYAALQKARRPFAAVWAPWGHSGFEEPRWPNHEWWGAFRFSRDETVPAIANASSNDTPKAGGRGEINTHVEWSSREKPFDKNNDSVKAVDEEGRWEMSFRSCNHQRTQSQVQNVDKQTADITPRRCRKFRARPGEKFTWQNVSYADSAKPAKVAEGAVEADKHGLVTVEKFEINKAGWGNRLVIERAKMLNSPPHD